MKCTTGYSRLVGTKQYSRVPYDSAAADKKGRYFFGKRIRGEKRGKAMMKDKKEDLKGKMWYFLLYIPPVLVVLPAVEHSEIKPAEACADFREMLAVSAVSAEKNPAFRGNKGKARPKGLVPGQ